MTACESLYGRVPQVDRASERTLARAFESKALAVIGSCLIGPGEPNPEHGIVRTDVFAVFMPGSNGRDCPSDRVDHPRNSQYGASPRNGNYRTLKVEVV